MHRGGIAIFTERIKSVHGLSKNKSTFKRTLQCFFLIMSERLLFILWKYECAFVIKNAIILWMSDLDVRTWIRIIAVLVLAFGEWGVESVRYLKVNVGNEWTVFLKREVDYLEEITC